MPDPTWRPQGTWQRGAHTWCGSQPPSSKTSPPPRNPDPTGAQVTHGTEEKAGLGGPPRSLGHTGRSRAGRPGPHGLSSQPEPDGRPQAGRGAAETAQRCGEPGPHLPGPGGRGYERSQAPQLHSPLPRGGYLTRGGRTSRRRRPPSISPPGLTRRRAGPTGGNGP